MAADPDPRGSLADATVSAESIDTDLQAAAEAVADGSWTPAPGDDAGASDCLAELHVIAGIKRAYAKAAADAPSGDLAAGESSASLGEAMSRALPASGRPDLAKARRWGPLFKLDLVGSGSFGHVYRAWDPTLDREVALKLLRVGPDPTSATTVVREGQLLASVRHPNVISVYGAAQIDGEVGIWMEFVRGRTLEQIVHEDGPLSAAEATVIGESLCGALAAVHQAGLLHRDLKAANVMRAAGGRIVLLDFGAGTPMTDEAGTSRLAGTPLYMAPEVLFGGAPSARSDIYSLGIVLFYLVTESYPVYGKTLEQLREAHSYGRRLLLRDVRSDLPAVFCRAVEFACAAGVSGRPASAGELSRALGGVVESTAAFRLVALSAGVLIAAGLIGPWLLGLLTTLAFNTALGRIDAFAVEPWPAYWLWGARSLLAPFVVIAVILVVCRAAIMIGRLLVPLLAATPVGTLRRRVQGWLMRVLPIDARAPKTWSEVLVLVNAGLLVALSWIFGDILIATISNLSSSDPAVFAPFQPENLVQRNLFRVAFSAGALLCAWSWQWSERRCYAAGQSVPLSGRLGAVMVTALFVFFLTVPYRLGWQNASDRYDWGGQRCYGLAAAAGDLLLYCPDMDAPRVATVARTDARLRRADVSESFFTPRPSTGQGE